MSWSANTFETYYTELHVEHNVTIVCYLEPSGTELVHFCIQALPKLLTR